MPKSTTGVSMELLGSSIDFEKMVMSALSERMTVAVKKSIPSIKEGLKDMIKEKITAILTEDEELDVDKDFEIEDNEQENIDIEKETDVKVGFVPWNRTVLPSVVVVTSVPKFPAVSPNTILNETISSLSELNYTNQKFSIPNLPENSKKLIYNKK